MRSEDLLPVAIASYIAINSKVAEVAFAVDDRFQGKGLSTLLLERLAIRAAQNGFEKFQATTLADNMPMLEVFRDSGFAIRSKTTAGVVELQLSLTPSAEGVRSAENRDRSATAASLVPMLTPRGGGGRRRVARSVRHRPSRVRCASRRRIHRPDLSGESEGRRRSTDCRVYRSARDLPAGTDLAVIVVPAAAVLARRGRLRGGGREVAGGHYRGVCRSRRSGRALQLELVERVRNHGMRMVGPNCMGLFNASADVRLNASFSPIMPPSGHVSLLSQSGALGIAILELAAERRLGLSTFISVGNKADVSGNDLLQYWEGDAETSVILLYLESFGNPRRFARIADASAAASRSSW